MSTDKENEERLPTVDLAVHFRCRSCGVQRRNFVEEYLWHSPPPDWPRIELAPLCKECCEWLFNHWRSGQSLNPSPIRVNPCPSVVKTENEHKN